MKSKRNDLAWWLIVKTLRHVATKDWADNFITKFNIKTLQTGESSPEHAVWRSVFPYGTRLASACPHCNKVFFQDINERAPYPKTYCSKTCQNRHRESMKKYVKHPRKCPTPGKASYRDGEAAHKHYATLKKVNPELTLNRPYACVCGKYHLGRVKYEVVSTR